MGVNCSPPLFSGVLNRVITMNDRKLNGLYAGCEVGTTYSRLAAGVALLKGVCVWHKAIVEEHKALCSLSFSISRDIAQDRSETGSGTGSGKRPAKQWGCRDTPNDLERIVTELRRRRDTHNADVNRWTVAVHEFFRLRASLLALKTVNGFQVKLQSVLHVAEHRDKWQGCLTTLHSIQGIHGHVLSLMPEFVFPKVLKHKRDAKTTKGVRLGVETGERMVRNAENYVSPPPKTRPNRNFRNVYDMLLSSNSKLLERQLEFVNQYVNSPFVRGRSISWGMSDEYRVVLQFARYIRSELPPHSKRAEALRRLHRLSGQSLCRQVIGIDYSPPERVGDIELTFAGGDGVQQTITVPVLQWRTVVSVKNKLELQEEFGAVFPEAYREFVANIATLHVSFTSDLENSIATLRSRLQSEFRRFQSWEKFRGDAQARRKQDRQLKSSLLHKLRAIPELSLRDSYAIGNCAAGTEGFCRQIGVSVDRIEGRELARKWHRAGMPLNSLFSRVIEHVHDKLNAGGVK